MFGRLLRFFFFKNAAISTVGCFIIGVLVGLVLLSIVNASFIHSNSHIYTAFWLMCIVLAVDYLFEAMKLPDRIGELINNIIGLAVLGFLAIAFIQSHEAGSSTIVSIFYAACGGFVIVITVIIFCLPQEISSITENPSFRRWFAFGQGGNARWAGPYSYRKTGKDRRGLFLGYTFFQDVVGRWPIRIPLSDDAHHVTIAATGSGKSVTALWTNIREYPAPMIVLDPKGEHASFAAASRHEDTYILDPFSRVTDSDLSRMRVNYNPLSEIDIEARGARGFLEAISDGCVVHEPRDKHFTDNAKTIIEGVIAHVLSRHPKSDHNLPFIADLFRGFDPELGVSTRAIFDDLISEMSTNNAVGGLPFDAANILMSAGDRERGATLTTCFRSLKWVTDPSMRAHLTGGDANILRRVTQFGDKRSLFIVLPFEYMDEASQIRWMRTLVNMVTVYLFRHPRNNDQSKLLFILDEFFKLGYMSKLEEGIVTARGAGLKYWILVQDIGQLRKLYGETWETFIGSSNVQVFGISHQETLNWVAAAIGGDKDASTGNYPLMRPDEVREFLGKDSPTQIVIPATGLPMRLERVAFQKLKNYRAMD